MLLQGALLILGCGLGAVAGATTTSTLQQAPEPLASPTLPLLLFELEGCGVIGDSESSEWSPLGSSCDSLNLILIKRPSLVLISHEKKVIR